MRRAIIGIGSVLGGYVLASLVVASLALAGFNVPAALAQDYSQYSTYQGLEVLIFMLGIGWAIYEVLAKRLLPPRTDGRPTSDRLRRAIQSPSAMGLIVAWVAAVFTVVLYPLAIWMTWRFYVAKRDGETKICPRCAEKVKAAALVCRHCGQPFEASVVAPVPVAPSEPLLTGPVGGEWADHDARPSDRNRRPMLAIGVIVGAVALVAIASLTFLGTRVEAVPVQDAASAPAPCVAVLQGATVRLEFYFHLTGSMDCEGAMAEMRRGFGPDTPTSRLSRSTVAPTGQSACNKYTNEGWIEVYAYGSDAARVGTEMCASISS